MKTLLAYLVVIFMVMGCAGTQKMTKPSDSVPAPKKFDLGELHFRWVVMFPLEVFVGTFTGALFMSPEQIEQLSLGMERLQRLKKEKREKKGHDLRDWWQK